MTLNKRRKYSNIKPFNDCCSTALHEATDKFLGEEGAVIRCGGELDLIKRDPKEAAQIKRNRKDRAIDNMVAYMKFISGEEQRSKDIRLGKTRLTVPEDHKENG